MAGEPVFVKELADTDIEHRLSFPTEHMGILPKFAPGSNAVEFKVRYGSGERDQYRFWCIKRRERYPKPTIDRGWSDVVRDKQLRKGDWLRFYVDQHEPTPYRIEVWRRSYSDNYGENWIPI